MNSILENHDLLRTLWSGLKSQWENTRNQWRDPVGDQFEREIWQEWEEKVPQALNAMAELDSVINEALRQTV